VNIIITVVICTHNREKYIEGSIRSLLDQTLDDYMYEIIVVDNRSTDNTAQIVKNLDTGGRNLRYLFEENIGLSYARNTGLRHAKGRYVAFLDDDAEASSTWLANIIACFENADDDVCSVGGPVEPAWEIPPPKWLTPTMKRALAVVNWNGSPHVLKKNQWLAGVNVAYKKTILETCGGFNTSLGRKGKNLLSMEETFLREQLEKKGKKSFYHPNIKVKHHIPRGRLKRSWFLKRSFWQGVSDARYDMLMKGAGFFVRFSYFFSYLGRPFKSGNRREEGKQIRKHTLFDLVCFALKQCGFAGGLLKRK
jgi:glycosyltransferase involved in cell wall biosynthesis